MPRTLAVVTIALALAACGLKGDLYLPPEPPPAAAPAEAPADADDSAGAEGDGEGDARRQVPPTPDRGQAQ
jgi:predicted small lipoprotein YifL